MAGDDKGQPITIANRRNATHADASAQTRARSALRTPVLSFRFNFQAVRRVGQSHRVARMREPMACPPHGDGGHGASAPLPTTDSTSQTAMLGADTISRSRRVFRARFARNFAHLK